MEADRCGEAVNKQLLQRLLRALSSLGMYADVFQRPFLDRTSQFYALEGERCVQVRLECLGRGIWKLTCITSCFFDARTSGTQECVSHKQANKFAKQATSTCCEIFSRSTMCRST